MHHVLVILGLTACDLGNDPSFPGGGTETLPTDDSGDSGDTGNSGGDSAPDIISVMYDWEDAPNTGTGWYLNTYIEYSDLEDDIVGGQVHVSAEGFEDSFEIGESEGEAFMEDGRVRFSLEAEPGDYTLSVKLEDAAGNKSEKYSYDVVEN